MLVARAHDELRGVLAAEVSAQPAFGGARELSAAAAKSRADQRQAMCRRP